MLIKNRLLKWMAQWTLMVCFGIISSCVFAKYEEEPVQDDNNERITRAEIDSMIKIGSSYITQEEEVYKAFPYLFNAFQKSRLINYYKGTLSSCRALGNYYLYLSDNKNATTYFYHFLKVAEAANDTTNIAEAYIRLGLVMYNMNKWDAALRYFYQADSHITNKKELPNNYKLNTYLKGVCLVRLKNYDLAKQYLDQAKEWALENGDTMRVYETRIALNNIRAHTHLTPEVYEEYNAICEYLLSSNEIVGYCSVLESKAKAYLSEGKPLEARENALEALAIVDELDYIYWKSEILATLVDAEEQLGNYADAYQYLSRLVVLRDSTNSMEVATQIALQGASYQFEKKEAVYDQEITNRTKEKRFYLFLFIMTAVIAVIIIFVLRLVGKQRKKLDLLLHNILPADTVRELQKTGHSIPKGHKGVTIVFSDVKSFTSIASDLKPNVLVKMLDRYFTAFDDIIVRHGLEKIKTIGDAYMFVSGLKQHPESAHRAASACLEMMQAIEDLRNQMIAEFGRHFEFRFGMHTGNIVSGVVGEIKYAFDIWGDAVNIAARMEEASEPGKINISQDSMNAIKDQFKCELRGTFDIKNRGEIEMYYLVGKLEPGS